MDCPEFDRKVTNWIEQENLLQEGDGVILGVSGGADSVALLRFFHRMQDKRGWQLLCVHVEHGLRGADSTADQRFVEALCRDLQIPCHAVSLGNQLQAAGDGSLEERARRLRYQVLEAEAAAWEKEIGRRVRIAVAHHSEDNAETMLFHLARGTGLDGLCGMPVQRGRIIRPFYQRSRQEIEAYLQELGQDFCTDATNEDLHYDRNRIRHQVLPELQQVNHRATEHMNRAALLLRQVTDYIRVQAEARLQQAREGELGLSYEPLADAPDFLKKEVLHLWLGEFIPGAKDIGATHLEELAELEHKPVGSRISLPGRWEIRRTYTGVVAERQPAAPGKTASAPAGKSDLSSEVADASKPEFWTLNREELEEKGCVETTIFGKKIRFCLFFYKEQEEIPRNSYTKWLDYGKIKDNIVIRCRKNGDYLTIRTDGSRQKLQDYMVNQKIPRELRDEVLLLCEGQHVIWVLDYRISEYYKIEQSTKQVLEVQILEEREHE